MNWLLRVTFACLAIVSALFVAHLGAEGHSDECHACEIAAHSVAMPAPLACLDPATTSEPAQTPLEAPWVTTHAHRSRAPRAPPTA